MSLIIVSVWKTSLAQDAAKPVEFYEDFTDENALDAVNRWDSNGFWWVEGGRLCSSSPGKTFVVASCAPMGSVQTIEAALTIEKPLGNEWKVAGIALYRDDANYFHLALVEAPNDAKSNAGHFIELTECLDGRWLADKEGETALQSVNSGDQDFKWEYNHPYRLRIEHDKLGIKATVAEVDGTMRAIKQVLFAEKKAVRIGRAALDCGAFEASFDDVLVRVATPEPEPERKEMNIPPVPNDLGSNVITAKGTGFFRVEEIDGRWWVITPSGRGFYMLGTDHASYYAHWCEKLGYAPYSRNMEKLHGSEEKWAAQTLDRLKAWGFNCLAANNSPKMRHQGLPHMEFIALGTAFAGIDALCPKVHWTGFPNVFSPRWETYCRATARQSCGRLKDDPWLLGYFLDNELEWYGKWGEHKLRLLGEAIRLEAGNPAKTAAVEMLKGKYPEIVRLNEAWGTGYESWAAFENSIIPPSTINPGIEADCDAFTRIVAERYFKVTTEATRAADPNHMILGCRFAGDAPDVWDIAGKYCDIVSVNTYRQIDLKTCEIIDYDKDMMRWHEKSGRPLMITEWSYPAYDSGLPCLHGAGQRVQTQTERSKAFRIFQSYLLTRPFVVGSDFFMWVDEPALGIASTFPEDSNYGLVKENGEPYQLLTQAATEIHGQVYMAHAGKLPELSLSLNENQRCINVTNRGDASAEVIIRKTIDGLSTDETNKLMPGATSSLNIAWPEEEGVHEILAELDPDLRMVHEDYKKLTIRHTYSRLPEKWVHGANTRMTVGIFPAPESTPNMGKRCGVIEVRMPDPWREITVKSVQILGPDGLIGEPEHWQLESFDDETVLSVAGLPLESGKPVTLIISGASGTKQQHIQTGTRKHDKEDNKTNAAIELKKSGPASFLITTGDLECSHEPGTAKLLSFIRYKGTMIGDLGFLLHQKLEQDLWVPPDTASVERMQSGPASATVDIRLSARAGGRAVTKVNENGTYSHQGAMQRGYHALVRLRFFAGSSYFNARLMELKNADHAPLPCAAYFFYPGSCIGGKSQDDEPVNAGGQTSYWRDTAACIAYGAIADDTSKFRMQFWVDNGGNQHPDISRNIDQILMTGDIIAGHQPTAFFYILDGSSPEGKHVAIIDYMRHIAPRVEILREEMR
ncbi:MAG TPA: beta-galactosidase [Candidatus Brocadiia bacterium]|nr:beta-galactosidase [Candidatus Brocadiia bacterium]